MLGLYCLQAGREFFLPVQGSGLSTSESCIHHLQAVHSWTPDFLDRIFSSGNVDDGTGEITQQLRALFALSKILSSIPSNHTVVHNRL